MSRTPMITGILPPFPPPTQRGGRQCDDLRCVGNLGANVIGCVPPSASEGARGEARTDG